MLTTYYIETIKPFSPLKMESGWAKKVYGIDGDYVIGFMGYKKILGKVISPNVPQTMLVPGHTQILNFVIEHSQLSKREAISRQRLLCALLSETLGPHFFRKLETLFLGETQISQTQLVASHGSCLIYYGIPIHPVGKDQRIVFQAGEVPIKDFTISLMQTYQEEIESMDYLAKHNV